MRVFNIVTNKTLKILDKYKISDEDIEDIIIRKIWLSLPSDIVTFNMIQTVQNTAGLINYTITEGVKANGTKVNFNIQ